MLVHGPEATYLVKKAKAAPAAGATEPVPETKYEAISGAGTKKAKKAWDNEQKRKEKAEATREKTERDAEEARVREAAKREEASKVVLIKDDSLGPVKRVSSGLEAFTSSRREARALTFPFLSYSRPRSTEPPSSETLGCRSSDGSTVSVSRRASLSSPCETDLVFFRSSSAVSS